MRILFLFLVLWLVKCPTGGKSAEKNSSSFVTIWASEASKPSSVEEKKNLL